MPKKYHLAVVIGRFQPFHNAHRELVAQALNLAEKTVIILGSAHSAPNVRNPFTPQMREAMVRACFPSDAASLIFRSVRDYPYNENVWLAEVQNAVAEIAAAIEIEHLQIALVGHFKDRTSYYLNSFPQWQFEDFWRSQTDLRDLNATPIREQFFESDGEQWKKRVPTAVTAFLEDYKKSEIYAELQREFDFIRKYKADTRFVGVPFDPVFVTTDTVVAQSGHVLVVRRKFNPGKGLLALPGGFLLPGSTLEESALKELKTETGIHVAAQILKANIKSSRVFDYPMRSTRGRTITHAFFIQLDADLKNGLPQVKGSDDADKAFWLPISSLSEREDEFFEDHVSIIRHFLGF